MIPPRIIPYLLRYLEEPNAERQKPGAFQGLGARGMGSSCLMGLECQFCKMKAFWRRMAVTVLTAV